MCYTVHVDNATLVKIFQRLNAAYPNAKCELEYDSAFHLLVAVILSAQCTDKRVNKVTEQLFKVYNSPYDFACANVGDMENLIFSCGFYHNKSKNIISMASDIVTKHDGEMPKTFDELLSLSGVGRKTANVIMAECYGGNNIAVDTHVYRTSRRLGLSSGNTPEKVEVDLMKLLQPSDYAHTHHLLIFFGRYCCKSANPDCDSCPVNEFCVYESKKV